MLDSFRKRQRWLTAIFIVAIGIVFVFFLGLGGPVSGPTASPGIVVELGEVQVNQADFQRVRAQQQQRLQDALGDQFDSRAAGDLLDSQAMRSVVDQVVLAYSAQQVGLLASTAEIKEVLLRDPSLRGVDGQFDQESFDAQIRWEYGNQKNFLAVMERQLLQQKMIELLLSQSQVSDAEARSAALFDLERIRIAFVALSADTLSEEAMPDDEAVQAYLEANEEALRGTYTEQSERFTRPEQIRLRHILFSIEAEADDDAGRAEIRAEAEKAVAQLQEGADFAALATELSDDTASKDQGGDLGTVQRGDLAPVLDEAAFALEVGATSEILEGPDGFHILLVEETQEAGTRPFDDVGIELAREAAVDERAKELAQELSAAVAEGKSVEDAARDAKLTLERTGLFTRRGDGFIPALGPSQEATAVAFALNLESPSSSQVFDVGDREVLIQLLERIDPEEEELTAATEAARSRLEQQMQNRTVQIWIDNTRETLLEKNELHINTALVGASF